MSFELANASGTFMCLIYNVLRKYLGKYVVVYIDNILIHLKTLLAPVESILITHRKQKFHSNRGSFWGREKVHF